MIVGSMFTGIAGIDVGLEACGLSIGWQCEAHPSRPRLRMRPTMRKPITAALSTFTAALRRKRDPS